MGILQGLNTPVSSNSPKNRRGGPSKAPEPKPQNVSLHNLGAEQATLGAMLMDAGAVEKARGLLTVSDFYNSLNGKIFAALCAVSDGPGPVDIVTVSEVLRARGELEETGGAEYLAALIESCPSSAQVGDYASILKDLAARRLIIERAREIAEIAPFAEATDLNRALANVAETAARAVSLARPRFALLSLADVENQPQKPAFIEGIAPSGCLFGLIGPYGSGKSFLAVDWALCAATGRPWHGRQVQSGPVVYITPEGTNAFGKRTRAWRCARGQAERPENFHLIAEAPLLMYPGDVEELLRTIATLPTAPALVVIDTVARHMTGGDENSQKDMGLFIAGADRIRAATGATVLLVHHTGKDGKMRGSTALPGALDAYAELQKTGEKGASLSCGKAKDAAPFDTLGLIGRVVELPELDGNGAPLTSLVFDVDTNGPKPAEITKEARRLLALLPETGASYSEWKSAATSDGIPEGSFDRLKRMLLASHVSQNAASKRYFRASNHQPSNNHQTAITMAPPSPELPQPSNHHTPLGVMVDGDGNGGGDASNHQPKSKKAKGKTKSPATYGND